MSYFYGNTINPSQFQFDKIYPNRKIMDDNCDNDGVFIGRYVLVKYDSGKEISRIYVDTESGYGYNSAFDWAEKTKILFKDLSAEFYYDYINNKQVFYKPIEEESTGYALFEILDITAEELSKTEYFQNLNKDKQIYGLEKISYDATVWQKAFINNKEKYIKVADLNSGIPVFDIAVDAPTHWPLTPHFETNSIEDQYQRFYRLHLQPNWGFRIAQADSEDVSDENIVWLRETYIKETNSLIKEYYDYINGQWKEYSEENNNTIEALPGAIYYNKDGFKKDKRSHIDVEDKISITAGKSGRQYRDHSSGELIAQDDMQELKILLPSLGNAISDIWDIVYGQERNLDINWNSLQGIRLSTSSDGYQYNTDTINTIAGCINSVHDLMGMIISEQPESAQSANENNIYWDGKKFSRKKKNYKYTEIIEGNDYEISDVIKPSENYYPNTYYYLNQGKLEKDIENKYNPDKIYKQKLLKTNYVKIENMKDFYDKNQHPFYCFMENNFILEKNETWNKDYQYFEILKDSDDFKKSTIEKFKVNYKDNTFYYEAEKNIWKKETADKPRKDCIYYDFTFISEEDKIPLNETNINRLWIRFMKDGKDTVEPLRQQQDSQKKKDVKYFLAEEDPSSGNMILTLVDVFEITDNHRQIDENGVVYYDKEHNKYPYQYYLQIQNGSYSNTEFYLPGLYYIESEISGNYYLSLDQITTYLDKPHYAFLPNEYIDNHKPENFLKLCTFFEPNIYFIDSKTIANAKEYAEIYDSKETYYKFGDEFYILKDERNSFQKGALWNNQVSLVPWPITLARREVVYEFEELIGFAKSYNTIHGLILKLNYLLEANDSLTRDTQTVKGAINKLNDIFYRFDQMVPNSMLSVGINGKIYSTKYESDNWINYSLDNVNHKLKISHKDIPDRNDLQDLMSITLDLTKPITITYDRKGHIHNIVN